jgi:hypothetical protein
MITMMMMIQRIVTSGHPLSGLIDVIPAHTDSETAR